MNVGKARARAKDLARSVSGLGGRIRPSFRLIKSLFMATIGKDRGFGFWWLMAMAAIALIIGLLVAALLSPVIGILAALVVAIWMLIRRTRSAQSRQAVQA
jgi:MASE7 protein